jgi:hypothetical protein
MAIISKILMALFSLVVQIIGFVLLFYMFCFAIFCVFTNSNKTKSDVLVTA